MRTSLGTIAATTLLALSLARAGASDSLWLELPVTFAGTPIANAPAGISPTTYEFEATIARCRTIEADRYVTFHHKGTVHGRQEFLTLLDEYEAVIDRREQALLSFLSTPRTIADMVAHRFVYRPHVQHVFADSVERRCAAMHVQRMLIRGEAEEVSPGHFQAA